MWLFFLFVFCHFTCFYASICLLYVLGVSEMISLLLSCSVYWYILFHFVLKCFLNCCLNVICLHVIFICLLLVFVFSILSFIAYLCYFKKNVYNNFFLLFHFHIPSKKINISQDLSIFLFHFYHFNFAFPQQSLLPFHLLYHRYYV